MSNKVPPKAPQPIIGEITHYTVLLNWKEYLDRLKEVFNPKTDGRILSEVQQRTEVSEDWTTIYSGYDSTCTARNLDPECRYRFKLRFKNKNGWGQFSDDILVKTLKQPLTGEHIHRAIRVENKEELLQILEKGEANIEAQDNLDFTPLMAASQKGLTEFVKILIEWRADLEAQNKSGKTALMLAAFKGHVECVDVLVGSGANLDTRDKSGLGVLHYAVDGEQTNMIRKLINLGANVDAVDYTMGWTPLIRCAGLKNNGNIVVAHELIRGNASIDKQDNDGKTALHNAIINNHAKLATFLLEKGASLELCTGQGHNAYTLAEALDVRSTKTAIEEFMEKQKQIN